MTPQSLLRRHPDAAIWSAVGAIVVIDAGFVAGGPFTADAWSFLSPGIGVAVLAALAWGYRTVRPEPALAATLTATAQLIGFTAVAAPLSYIAATAGFPLRDAMFAHWDDLLGVNWTEALGWLSERPALREILQIAYASFSVQTIVVLLTLGFARELARLRVFALAFVTASLMTIAMSAVLPAAGPWLFYHLDSSSMQGFLPSSSTSWPVFFGLRDGTQHALHGLRSEGIVTFPSLHSALALLFAIALWRIPGLRWIALALNAAMLIATPFYGSHYLVDVIAGVLIAATSWAVLAPSILRNPSSDAVPRLDTAPPLSPVLTASEPDTTASQKDVIDPRPVARTEPHPSSAATTTYSVRSAVLSD